MFDIIRSVISAIMALMLITMPGSTEQNKMTHENRDPEVTISETVPTTDHCKPDPSIEIDSKKEDDIGTNAQEDGTHTSQPNNNSAEETNPTDTSTQNDKNAKDSHTQNESIPDATTKPAPNTNNNDKSEANDSDDISKNENKQDVNQNPTQEPSNTPTAKPNDKETESTQQPENSNNEEYAGDTAVPDDVYNQPAKCSTHDLKLDNTRVDTEYELYSYVTKTYKCNKCTYQETSTELASNQLSPSELRSIANRIVKNVNELRQANGLSLLTTSSAWNDWADTRAKEQAQRYGHARPNGGSWMYGIGGQYTIAENVASGQSSGYNFFNAFSNSSQHKSNMLCTEATMIAVGVYVTDTGMTYCAMILIAE